MTGTAGGQAQAGFAPLDVRDRFAASHRSPYQARRVARSSLGVTQDHAPNHIGVRLATVGLPARGYSWAPFEKGNTAALTPGA